MKPRYAPTKAAIVCLVALGHGNLTCIGQHWLFEQKGRCRLFSPATVNGLIAAGLAQRVGDIVSLVTT